MADQENLVMRQDDLPHLVSMHFCSFVFIADILYSLHIYTNKGMFIGLDPWLNLTSPIKFPDVTYWTNSTSPIQLPGVTYWIWFVIYAWLFGILVFYSAGMCRKGDNAPSYRSPLLLPPVFYIALSLAHALNLIWLIVVVGCMLPYAGPLILGFLALMLYLCIAISMVRVRRVSQSFTDHPMELWSVVLIIQNGLALYAGWVTLLATIQAGDLMEIELGLSRPHVRVIVLYFILAELVAWFLCDMIILGTTTRYLVMPYFIACWTTGSIAVQAWRDSKNTDDTTLPFIIMVVCLGLFFWKAGLLSYQHNKSESYVKDVIAARPTLFQRLLSKC